MINSEQVDAFIQGHIDTIERCQKEISKLKKLKERLVGASECCDSTLFIGDKERVYCSTCHCLIKVK